ncbi:acyltransferase family protein [Aliarcobacter butzleri]|uniref:Acyltransferase family protein n=1 Tax=Aliarcobacter butzleri TaxID=28197 RepID=A0AAP4PX07_9BACT|nr:acyltransferase family protein [Aliarcobacter butzleri]MDN5051245.1 acyltransferase family protein [Aliarcobacter butzleri]MDN5075438.1 acyltransferase family protein [Aliarcobacter butzleri]MDN5117032.1 acyltransferase family protein [Aliarcobacter butzleri]MDN5131517.1 acyltransferase family protein [Aliarcobacter butzleri]
MQLISKKYIATKYTWIDFYFSRLLRIYPYYIIVLVCTLLIPLLFSFSYKDFGLTTYIVNNYENLSIFSTIYIFFSNIFILGMEWSFIFSIGNNASEFIVNPMQGIPLWMFFPVGQAWSISLELLFYLLFPIIVKLKNKSLVILLMGIYLLHIYILTFLPEIYNSGSHRFFLTALRFFIIGMLSYRFYDYILNNKKYYLFTLKNFFVLFFLHLLFYLYKYQEINIILFAFFIPILFYWTKKSKLDNFIGEYSFYIYIWHILVLYVYRVYYKDGGAFLILVVTFMSSLQIPPS